ncbi:hypothetical protein [Pseudomonas sp. BIOMIG1BAC]|uniref:hypothetical protein n=1 Tax=Pseudomonas sp. BIOMIG1BAC TaxID=1758730 RepID=UPI0015B46B4E|nr:hypothetical protein [Pseudomonas sp. BIOMIG1BAC]
MSNDEAKAYIQEWNGQDLAKIDVNSPKWASFALFISDPENQAAVASVAVLGKSLIGLAKTTVSNISRSGASTGIKSMQVGLRNPQQVDQIKNDMLSNNYRFTAPEGRIAGYVDSKGIYYISEGNHRMVAAQEIFRKTGDASFIGRRQKLSATPDLSGTVLPLCHIPNSALKNAPPSKSATPRASACAGLLA